ncbi:YcaO-like family protein [Paraburkholderia bannensis]|uniref:YcaO-like family protein n=1 Tax=Paraburkholderia bannensis TaxID=765414 RepID=UPI002ABDA917|nr:YcaO-like family protein [Paraburkholderia bannensis]
MSLRSLTPKQVTTMLLAKKEQLGISRIADLGPFTTLDVRVVQAVRVTLVKGQVSATTGKGWNLRDAICGALGEASERYCAAHMTAPDLCIVKSLPMAELSRWGHDVSFTPRDICVADELLSNDRYLVPAIEVCFPYHGVDLQHTRIRPHTSGLAGGATLDEATLFGLIEVIERHASSAFFEACKSIGTGTIIDLNSEFSPRVAATIHNLRDNGYECLLFRIDALLPVYYVAILDASNLGPKFMVGGVAAHLNETDALESALLESMQGVVIAAQGAREDLVRFDRSYRAQSSGSENPFYRIRTMLERRNPTRRFESLASISMPLTAQDALRQLLDQLRSSGLDEAYRCDLSQPDMPLKVAKVIVPGLFDSRVNPSRKSHAPATA